MSLKCAKIQLLIVRAGSSHGCQLRPALHRAGSVRQVDRAGKGPAKVLIDLGPSQTVSGESVRLAGPGTTTDDASLGKPKLNDVGAMVAFGPEIIPLLPVVVPVMAIMQVFPGEKVLLHKDVSVVAHVGENVAVDPGKLKSAQAQFRKSLRAVEMFSCFSYAAGAPAPNGDLDGAIKGCQQALASEPNSFYLPYLHFKTASLFLEKRDFVHAIPEYRTVVQLDPKDERFRIGLVNALEDSGDLDTAFVKIKEAIRIWLDRPYFHYLLGRWLVKKSDPDAAIVELQLDLKKEINSLANCALGRALELKGNPQAALRQYRTAFRAHQPDDQCRAAYERLRLQLKK